MVSRPGSQRDADKARFRSYTAISHVLAHKRRGIICGVMDTVSNACTVSLTRTVFVELRRRRWTFGGADPQRH